MNYKNKLPKFNNKLNECTKTEDGRTVFLSRSIAICIPVSVYIKETGKYYELISQRGAGTPDYNFHYNLVCGYLDYNETLIEASKRELFEETGLDIDSINTKNIVYGIDNKPWDIGDVPNTKLQNVTMRFGIILEFDTISELPKLSNKYCEPNEVESVEWVETKEVMRYINSSDVIRNNNLDCKWAFNHHVVFRQWKDFMVKELNL